MQSRGHPVLRFEEIVQDRSTIVRSGVVQRDRRTMRDG